MAEQAEIGLIGLGTMGAALALNIAEKGFTVAVFNRTTSVTDKFAAGAGALSERVVPCHSLDALRDAIRPPRAIILMVPAGAPVDDMIEKLRPVLDVQDLVIDAGNADFHDTMRRAEVARAAGQPYLGIGVSGGEEGARHGPSIMGGGEKAGWERVAPVLEAIAAKYEETPCATWMGPDGAGHFVKTVHNGIEYADMQMIAEVYGMMRDGLQLAPDAIGDVFARWNEGPLASYLIEISAEVARTTDPKTGKPLLDVILDRAGQKGTGRWTAIEALHLGAPATAIEAAVAARNLSARLDERKSGEAVFGPAPAPLAGADGMEADLETALLAGKIACYAQGFGLLSEASRNFGWKVPLPEVAKVWRAGCIIRSDMLSDMAEALAGSPDTNLMFAPAFAAKLEASHGALRRVVAAAALAGHPVPALAAALAYFDAMRTARGTANMIQGQRDFFGRHGFERIDAEGAFHGPWAES
ncbi:MAG: NADP-dependent phosphogluconate dehydrogenase [Rhodobacteraceae bacterium]|nr:NADP-dependent phosphogluconate dehydrogenase [Paracoccaceae bacterium]